MKRLKILLIVFIVLLLAVISSSCALYDQNEIREPSQEVPAVVYPDEVLVNEPLPGEVIEDPVIEPTVIEKPVESNEPPQPPEPPAPVLPTGRRTLKISAVGDIMMHLRQVESAALSDGSFDFKPVFKHIKSYLEAADIAMGNIETTISTPERGFYGFPRFRSPKEVIEALKYSGFDVITTSNNHIFDGTEFGLEHTLNTLDEHGLLHTGAARTPEEREHILIIEKNDIKIAVLAYTYGTNGMEAAIDEHRLGYMITYLHEDDVILSDIKRAEELGADIIIACLHWGAEYQRMQNAYQEEMAEKLIRAGVDIIFGSHPHVVQPIVKKAVTTETSESREGLVVYSMGNFVSNQRNRFRDSGIIVNVTIVKDYDQDKVYIGDVTFVPTWVHRYSAANQEHYRILPVGSSLDTGLYSEIHSRLKEVWKETTEHIENFEPIR